jgi:outer membrane protein OmpA-like peptidoglycan-associated protein
VKLKLMAATAVLALATASGAHAQFFDFSNGAYVAGDIGIHESTMETKSAVNTSNFDFSPDSDFAGFLRAGYRFNENLRLELEGGYRKGEVESVRTTGGGLVQGLCTPGVLRTATAPKCGPINGELNAASLMLNAIYDFDFDFGLFGQRIVPFAGVGVGFAEIHNKAFGQISNVPAFSAPIQNVVIDDVERAFAYQGILGLAFELSQNLSLDLTGRFLRTNEVEFGARTYNAGGASQVGNLINFGRFEGEYRDTSVSVGLRYTFAAPPPPPPPMQPEPMQAPEPAPLPTPEPAPAPVAERPVNREFIVYFPFDQSVLTPEAQTVVQEAASYAQQGAATQVQVVGHADTSGSAAYNIRLSERRARAVADAMVGLGVNPATITADWRGEANPAVATGDGVKEPLNRRSTVSVNF